LNGDVDGSDFGIWNAHKFTSVAAWCSGDFSANGVIDGSDLGIWNAHKFTSAAASNVVPEPIGMILLPLLAWAWRASYRFSKPVRVYRAIKPGLRRGRRSYSDRLAT
jgi:hypothetical protein